MQVQILHCANSQKKVSHYDLYKWTILAKVTKRILKVYKYDTTRNIEGS